MSLCLCRVGLFLPVLVVLTGVLTGCAGSPAATRPQISLNPKTHVVEVTGLPAASLGQLANVSWSDAEWQALLRVTVKVAAAPAPAVAGSYAARDGVLRFTPMFPFDEGRQYDVTFDGARLPGGEGATSGGPITAVVGRPGVVRTPSTVVTRVYPSANVVPANQLRLYLHFSAPMDWRSGYDYVTLLDDQGHEVVDAFLPLDADFWNDDRTRYTVFFDPGRVKRGILPNRQMGRALEAGKRYTLVVKQEWRDGHGMPLKEEFRHQFSAGRAIEAPLSMTAWTVAAPNVGTREPLRVTFPAPLDDGLLRRALGVAKSGKAIEGTVAIESGETRWSFTPASPWMAGTYELVALAFLEDLAGNRIGRAFEVDNFERTDISAEPERRTLPFSIKSGT